MFYLDSNFINTLKLLPVESIGKIIKNVINEEATENLNEFENDLYLNIKSLNEEKQTNYKAAALKRWQKRKAEQKQQTQKEQKEDLPKRDLPIQQTNFKKPVYNNYKPLPSISIQQTQKEKEFIKEYQNRGALNV